MMPSSPPGPITGTDQELATLAARARSRNGAQAVPTRTFSSTTGGPATAPSPTGPPAGPWGSRDHADTSSGERPSEAAQTSEESSSRWIHRRSLPSAAPSAERISDRLDDGSADTRPDGRPGRRVRGG